MQMFLADRSQRQILDGHFKISLPVFETYLLTAAFH